MMFGLPKHNSARQSSLAICSNSWLRVASAVTWGIFTPFGGVSGLPPVRFPMSVLVGGRAGVPAASQELSPGWQDWVGKAVINCPLRDRIRSEVLSKEFMVNWMQTKRIRCEKRDRDIDYILNCNLNLGRELSMNYTLSSDLIYSRSSPKQCVLTNKNCGIWREQFVPGVYEVQ